jgi:hypothetical protein
MQSSVVLSISDGYDDAHGSVLIVIPLDRDITRIRMFLCYGGDQLISMNNKCSMILKTAEINVRDQQSRFSTSILSNRLFYDIHK